MKDKLMRLAYKLGAVSYLRGLKKETITVLSLHRISPARDYFFDPIDPERFEALVRYCSKHYFVTSFHNLAEPSKVPKLILSFDDGYYDFIEYALPILSKYKMPSNHNYVITSLERNDTIWTQTINDILSYGRLKNLQIPEIERLVGKKALDSWVKYKSHIMKEMFSMNSAERNMLVRLLKDTYPQALKDYRMMSWSDAKMAIGEGVEPGTHTRSHTSLKNVKSPEELYSEIGSAKAEMEKKLGAPIDIIAFPNGQHNEEVVTYCESIGLNKMLLVKDASLPVAALSEKTIQVPRINMVNESFELMALRTELFQTKLKNLRG